MYSNKSKSIQIFQNIFFLIVNTVPRTKNDSTIIAPMDSEDEPFYDKVASDDEFTCYNNGKPQRKAKTNKKTKKVRIINICMITLLVLL